MWDRADRLLSMGDARLFAQFGYEVDARGTATTDANIEMMATFFLAQVWVEENVNTLKSPALETVNRSDLETGLAEINDPSAIWSMIKWIRVGRRQVHTRLFRGKTPFDRRLLIHSGHIPVLVET